ncbi:MAG: peptidylprolyl isomerase [Deltaproteobacteria bacterium]|nr:peptidylprolyl isomerase [Deltaproteobacteria bacterium]
MILKTARLLVIFVVLVFAAALPAAAQNVAVVNGKAITASAVDLFVKQAVAQGQVDTPELREMAKEQLIIQALLFQEADKQGYGKHSDIKRQVEQNRQMLMIRAMLTDYFKKNPVKDALVQAEYEKFKAQAATIKEYNSSHILVETEDAAKAIIAKLKAGGKFEELAKESKDEASAAKGGNLDWAPATNYVKPFGDALAALKKGEFTDAPVQTQFGYHVIKLEDVRTAEVPTLEEVKPQIVEALEQKQFMTFQDNLRKKAKIK